MKTYTLSEQGLSQIRRRFLKQISMVLLGTLVAVAVFNIVRTNGDWIPKIIALPIVFSVMAFSAYQVSKQQLEIWQSVRIELGDDYIARSQVRIPQIRIHRGEVTSIEETSQGLCLYTLDKSRSLIIPKELDSLAYQEIESFLSSWTNIKPLSSTTKIKNSFLLVIFLVGFGIIFFSSALWLVLLVGVILLGFYGYIYWMLYHDDGIDPQFRRHFIKVLIFIVFIISLKVYLLTSGAL